MPGNIPDNDSVLLGKVFNLILEETVIHGCTMGKHDAVIPLTFHPIVHRTMFTDYYFVFHGASMAFPKVYPLYED